MHVHQVLKSRRLGHLLLALALGLMPCALHAGETLRRTWDAAQLWSEGASRGVVLRDGALQLEDCVLVEDDAPAFGSSKRGDFWETIKAGTVLRKELLIERWPVAEATLTMMVYPLRPEEPLSGAKLRVAVNGHAPQAFELKHFWTAFPIPVEQLRAGLNTIDVTADAEGTEFQMLVALDENFGVGSLERTQAPGRSLRSTDGGATWSREGLGNTGTLRGEYPIRLKLRAYGSEGWLETPPLVLGPEPQGGVLLLAGSCHAATLAYELEPAEEARARVMIRAGDAHHPDAAWTAWREAAPGALPEDLLAHRHVQLRLELGSARGDRTPRLRGVTLEMQWEAAPAVGEMPELAAAENHAWRAGSYPMPQEEPTLPALRELRAQHGLDAIVGNAATELETMHRLRGWAAGLWNWSLPGDEYGDLTAWDARRMLAPRDAQGKALTPAGYCLNYSVVLAQACQSFGIPARIVNLNYAIWGGHEVVEAWSREHNKWIMLDANFDTSFVDKASGTPLDVLELHEVFLASYYPGGEVVDRDTWSNADRARRLATQTPETLPVRLEIGGHALGGKLKDYTWWDVTKSETPGYDGGYGLLNTAEVRWLPRSNWLSQPLPMPLNHGNVHWGWDGYLAWTDAQTPPTPEHREFVARCADVYPVLFNVDLRAELIDARNVEVRLATQGPGFDHYAVTENGTPRELRTANLRWSLREGLNTLEARAVDTLGNRGPASRLELRVPAGP